MRNRWIVVLVGLFLMAGTAAAQPDAVEPSTRVWGGTEFLLWWIKSGQTPPLVTTGPAGSGAILGQGGVPLFGGAVGDEDRFGGRFKLGYWLDDEQAFGVETNYFFLGSRTVSFAAGPNGDPGTPVIARPFFNVNSQMQDSQLVADPGVLAGTVGVDLVSRLQGAELNGVWRPDPCYRLDFLGGFRWVQLREGLSIDENLQGLPGAPGVGGEQFIVSDEFGTTNNFYGFQVGARAEFRRDVWFLDLSGKVGLGETHETAKVEGVTSITAGGTTTTTSGGLLALGSNMGHYSHDSFGFVPELGVTVGYQPSERVRLFAGYTFLYWSAVARPGSQIDTTVNATLIPVVPPVGTPFGAPRPGFAFHEADFWAQGIQFGMEFRY